MRRVRRAPFSHHVRQARQKPVLQAGRPEAGRQGGPEHDPVYRHGGAEAGVQRGELGGRGREVRQRGAGQRLARQGVADAVENSSAAVAVPRVAAQACGVACEAGARADDARRVPGEGADARAGARAELPSRLARSATGGGAGAGGGEDAGRRRGNHRDHRRRREEGRRRRAGGERRRRQEEEEEREKVVYRWTRRGCRRLRG
mmetsp:Transcript_8369/g.35498  ORF Transcript_8369/g.35498 Transcript_8369/m.35498 type:complete len:203 (+) Transcript_8369:556-1164(+)